MNPSNDKERPPRWTATTISTNKSLNLGNNYDLESECRKQIKGFRTYLGNYKKDYGINIIP
jgi:hypothetical protein